MKDRLTLVLDTNVFLVALAKRYKYYWIFEAILQNKFDICVSNEILLEYQEVIEKRYGIDMTNETLDFLMLIPNIKKINPYFKWPIIINDPDDNKFVECALSGNAHFIISNDKHFTPLKEVDFPRIQVLRVEEFEAIFKNELLE
jgi:uncharacterized protein